MSGHNGLAISGANRLALLTRAEVALCEIL